MIVKECNVSGIIAGYPRFILPDLPKCERVDRCTYRLSFEDTGPMHVKVGMAMCNLLPRERHSRKLGKFVSGYCKNGEEPVEWDDCRPYRGWLARMTFFAGKEGEPLLALYIDPHEFNYRCVHFNHSYSDERIMRLLGMLIGAYYARQPAVNAHEMAYMILKQCEDAIGCLGMYDVMLGDDSQEESVHGIIADSLANPDIRNIAIPGCHGRLAIDWIRERFPLAPTISEQ